MTKTKPVNEDKLSALVENLESAFYAAKSALAENKRCNRRETEEALIRVRRNISVAKLDLDRL